MDRKPVNLLNGTKKLHTAELFFGVAPVRANIVMTSLSNNVGLIGLACLIENLFK